MDSPFGSDPVAHVRLGAAPLARVLTQVRFPRLSTLAAGDDTANAFAAAMSGQYPILNEQREVAVTITPEGVEQSPVAGKVWQLRSADEQWQVSFGHSFLAVDTASYTSREDFLTRVEEAWTAFVAVARPPFVERVGWRYINRITDADTLGGLGGLVRPEVLGGIPAVADTGVRLVHGITESLYSIDEFNGLQARWGMLPGGAVIDPTLPPAVDSSWILDLDAFRTLRSGVTPAEVRNHVHELAERAYRYFRWVVTPDFLTQFEGELE